jgi:hypothetical protein
MVITPRFQRGADALLVAGGRTLSSNRASRLSRFLRGDSMNVYSRPDRIARPTDTR